MESHDINLNIHYSATDWVWEKISAVYRSMEYWCENDSDGPFWKGEDIELWASVEPGGIQIYGDMPEKIWNKWYAELKGKLTKELGYEIGEPEEGFDFKFEWTV